MKLVYLAHPVSGEVIENLAKATRWYAYLINFHGVAVVADWVLTCRVLDDANPEDRARGIEINRAVIERCDEVWLTGGTLTRGMLDEAMQAIKAGKPVLSFLHLGLEPPTYFQAAHDYTEKLRDELWDQ